MKNIENIKGPHDECNKENHSGMSKKSEPGVDCDQTEDDS